MRAIILAVAALLVAGSAISRGQATVPDEAAAAKRAVELKLAVDPKAPLDWQETIDLLYPDCRHTPIAQMTRERLEFCDAAERMMRGMQKAIDEEKARRAQASQQPTARAPCVPSADIICEHWTTETAPKPAGRRRTQ